MSRRRVRVAFRFGLGLTISATVSLASPRTMSPIRFEDRHRESGISFVLDNGTTPDKPIIDAVLGGVALLDFDDDGRLDVFFANGARIPGLVKDDPRFWNRLYRNEGAGRFRDVTEVTGVRGEGYSIGAAAADFDNDGATDLYVTGVNRNFLYRNERDQTFSDVTEQAGVSGIGPGGKKLWSVGAAWLDYDNDSDLDLFVANYPGTRATWSSTSRCTTCSPPSTRASESGSWRGSTRSSPGQHRSPKTTGGADRLPSQWTAAWIQCQRSP